MATGAETGIVVDKDGRRGRFDTRARSAGGDPSRTLVQMEDGRELLVETALLQRLDDGRYYLPVSLGPIGDGNAVPGADTITVPVIQEQLDVRKRKIRKGGIRVTKRVRHVERTVDQPGIEEEVEVERVPINRVIEAPVPVRYEGDTIVVPVLKEVVVVEKRLVLKEELRITKHRRQVRNPQKVTLRSEEVLVKPLADEPPESGKGNAT